MGAEWVKQQLIGEAANAAANSQSIGRSYHTWICVGHSCIPGKRCYNGRRWYSRAYRAKLLGVAAAKTLGLAGARYNGGAVNGGNLYRVGEHGKMEMFTTTSGKQYMIPGENGRITPNRDLVGGGGITMNNTFNITAENGWTERTAKRCSRRLRIQRCD
ncbi:hypothetical protein [Escherichia coli]|uniref:hypothetical protein n=1 Tax=Escherichia coli TaxID=562 RepID=UPI00106BA04E|nr:hypothetical protein [Escherichia coli]VFT03668.1 Uncharacterised protein [Escherichia coli]